MCKLLPCFHTPLGVEAGSNDNVQQFAKTIGLGFTIKIFYKKAVVTTKKGIELPHRNIAGYTYKLELIWLKQNWWWY
jgi:hypothetical protein